MAEVIEIDSLDHPGARVFASMTDAQLRNRLDESRGVFVAESPKVIRVALASGHEPLALMCERRHIDGDARDIVASLPPGTPVYTAGRELLASITGYTLTRGVLCAMRRPSLPPAESICREARRVAVLDGVCDTTNIGAIFRSAAALGIDAVLLTPDCCDPFNRRAVRVSMGSVFLVPWTWLRGGMAELRLLGFKTIAMALREDSYSLEDPRLKAEPKLAIVLGTEGDGLAQSTIDATDFTVKIPMHHGVDSLNVAAASAVAFWELCK